MTKKRLSLFSGRLYDALRGLVKNHGRAHLQDPSWSQARHVLKQVANHRKATAEKPVQAYCALVEGLSDLYVPAKSHSQARWVIVKEQRDAGFKYEGMFSKVRVVRAPRYDTWALTARKKSHTADEMPKANHSEVPA